MKKILLTFTILCNLFAFSQSKQEVDNAINKFKFVYLDGFSHLIKNKVVVNISQIESEPSQLNYKVEIFEEKSDKNKLLISSTLNICFIQDDGCKSPYPNSNYIVTLRGFKNKKDYYYELDGGGYCNKKEITGIYHKKARSVFESCHFDNEKFDSLDQVILYFISAQISYSEKQL